MCNLKADHWACLRQFRRFKWPNIGRQGLNIFNKPKTGSAMVGKGEKCEGLLAGHIQWGS